MLIASYIVTALYLYFIGIPLATPIIIDFIRQVSQLLRTELEELVDVARATIEPIKLCDEEW